MSLKAYFGKRFKSLSADKMCTVIFMEEHEVGHYITISPPELQKDCKDRDSMESNFMIILTTGHSAFSHQWMDVVFCDFRLLN